MLTWTVPGWTAQKGKLEFTAVFWWGTWAFQRLGQTWVMKETHHSLRFWIISFSQSFCTPWRNLSTSLWSIHLMFHLIGSLNAFLSAGNCRHHTLAHFNCSLQTELDLAFPIVVAVPYHPVRKQMKTLGGQELSALGLRHKNVLLCHIFSYSN